MGGWRILDYREPIRESGARGLAILEKRNALEVAGSIPALLFNYQEPRLRLTSAEQEFVRVACSGMTDRELCGELGLSKETIKRRWLTLFDKCAKVVPQLAPEASGDSTGVRGPQKRHHLLEYIRKHPEETRPFYWQPRNNVNTDRKR
jgi:DNA-binding CsgD family transcriptional regulator